MLQQLLSSSLTLLSTSWPLSTTLQRAARSARAPSISLTSGAAIAAGRELIQHDCDEVVDVHDEARLVVQQHDRVRLDLRRARAHAASLRLRSLRHALCQPQPASKEADREAAMAGRKLGVDCARGVRVCMVWALSAGREHLAPVRLT